MTFYKTRYGCKEVIKMNEMEIERVNKLTALKAELIETTKHDGNIKKERIIDRIESEHKDIKIEFGVLYANDVNRIDDLCEKHKLDFYISDRGCVLIF